MYTHIMFLLIGALLLAGSEWLGLGFVACVYLLILWIGYDARKFLSGV